MEPLVRTFVANQVRLARNRDLAEIARLNEAITELRHHLFTCPSCATKFSIQMQENFERDQRNQVTGTMAVFPPLKPAVG
jgi:hypothetical protein